MPRTQSVHGITLHSKKDAPARILSSLIRNFMNIRNWIVFSLIAIIAIFSVFVSYVYYHRVDFASLMLSRALTVPAKMDAFDFTQNGIRIKYLSIDNPKAAATPIFLRADSIDIEADWKEVLKCIMGASTMHIHKIKIHSAELSTSNMQQILSQMAHDRNDTHSRKCIIKKLIFTHLKLHGSADTFHKKLTLIPPHHPLTLRQTCASLMQEFVPAQSK